MGWILDFFFSGTAASIVLVALLAAVIWVTWALRYNRE